MQTIKNSNEMETLKFKHNLNTILEAVIKEGFNGEIYDRWSDGQLTVRYIDTNHDNWDEPKSYRKIADSLKWGVSSGGSWDDEGEVEIKAIR